MQSNQGLTNKTRALKENAVPRSPCTLVLQISCMHTQMSQQPREFRQGTGGLFSGTDSIHYIKADNSIVL